MPSRIKDWDKNRDRLAVAVIASSGGGTATLGHTDPPAFLHCINRQLKLVQGGGFIRHALYVSLDGGKSMDSANPDLNRATLYQIDHRYHHHSEEDFDCPIVKRGTLRQVNEYCQQLQKAIAKAIRGGRSDDDNARGGGGINGLICISCHTEIFADTLEAAAMAEIPVTGSGGTSLSQAASRYRLNLVGNAGGSVATTSYTRAVSYAHALAQHYRLDYQPWKENKPSYPSWTSVLNASLPAFWGVCLAKHALGLAQQYVVGGAHDPTVDNSMSLTTTGLPALTLSLENYALPSVCSVVMATTASTSSSSSSSSSSHESHNNETITATTNSSTILMAAVLASSACSKSILGGLLAGYLVSIWSDRMLYGCIFKEIPATMTNLLTSGGVGAIVAVAMLPIARVLGWVTHQIRRAILASILITASDHQRLLRFASGCVWGILSCYGSKVGYYHAVHLPLILIELEETTGFSSSGSFLGAVDELTLVLVCAGICLGNLLMAAAASSAATSGGGSKLSLLFRDVQVSDADIALSRRGLRINLCYGDFIECCYPFMESSRLINLGGYLGSALSCAWLILDATSLDDVPKSLAYLPWPVSVALAGQRCWKRYVGASIIAVGIPFLATIGSHLLVASRDKSNKSS